MLYYIFLLVIGITVGLVALWLIEMAVQASKRNYKIKHSRARSDLTSHLKDIPRAKMNNDLPTPWENGHQSPESGARTHPEPTRKAAKQDWSSDGRESGSHGQLRTSPCGSKTEAQYWGFDVIPDQLRPQNEE